MRRRRRRRVGPGRCVGAAGGSLGRLTRPYATERCDIKGNIGRSGECIYHVPGGRCYDATRIDRARGER